MKNFVRLAAAFALCLAGGGALAQSSEYGKDGGYSYPPRYPTPPHPISPVPNILCPSSAPLIGGQCVDATGFSGAALASQALSSLSQSSTQLSSDKAMGKIEERREQEANPRPAPAAQPSAPPPVAPPPAGGRQQSVRLAPEPQPAPRRARETPEVVAAPARKPRIEEPVAARRRAPVETEAPRHAAAPVKRQPTYRAEPIPAPRSTPAEIDGLPRPVYPLGTLFGTPVPITPGAKFGVWAQGYGDYEQRTANGGAYSLAGPAVPNPVIPVRLDAKSQTTSYGLQFGGDVTTRDVFAPGDGLITGAMIGWSNADLSLQTRSTSFNPAYLDNGSSQLNAAYTGGLLGLYATYFNGGFSADFLVKTDIFDLTANFSDNIAFAPNALGPGGAPIYAPAARILPYSASTSMAVADVNLTGNLNYRLRFHPRFWVEPTVGAMYTSTMYDWRGSRIGLADGEQVRLQGGARLGTETVLGATPTTLTLTGLAYNDVLIAGGFVNSLAFQGQNLLQQANQNQVRGRGIIALNFDHGGGITSFVQGEVRGGYGLIGGGGRVGVRYNW